MSGCKECIEDHLTCSSCDHSLGYFAGTTFSNPVVSPGACILREEIPDTCGADPLSFSILKCLDSPNCVRCRDDYSLCTECTSTTFLDLSTGSCLTKPQIPQGFGPDPKRTLRPCLSNINCLKCSDSFTQCESCDILAGYYLYANECLNKPHFPPSKGPNISLGELTTCVPNCLKCSNDYSTCEACDGSNLFFLNSTTGLCVALIDIPGGSGPNFETRKVEYCENGCLDCNGNSLKCTECATQDGFYLDRMENQCVHRNSIPLGFGINFFTNEVSPCSVLNCADCGPDSRICTKCFSTHELALVKEGVVRCDQKAKLLLSSKRFYRKFSRAIVQFNAELGEKDYLDLIVITVLNIDNSIFEGYNSPSMELTENKKGFYLYLNFTQSIYGGRLLIKAKEINEAVFESHDGKMAFEVDEVIGVSEVTISIEPRVRSLEVASEGGAAVLKSTSGASKLALIAASPSASVALDKLGSYFGYLRYLDGPTIIMPDIILEMMSEGSILPFGFPPNPFKRHISYDCTPSEHYYNVGVECNILVNFGQDLIVLSSILLTSFLLIIVAFFCRRSAFRKKEKEELEKRKSERNYGEQSLDSGSNQQIASWDLDDDGSSLLVKKDIKKFLIKSDPLYLNPSFRCFYHLQHNLGFKIFMVTAEGIQLQMIGLAIVNILSVPENQQFIHKVGMYISIGIILYFALVGFLVFKFVTRLNSIKRKIDRRKKEEEVRKKSQKLLQKVGTEEKKQEKEEIDGFQITCGIAEFAIEGFKPRLKKEWYFFSPIVVILKDILIQILALKLSGKGNIQLITSLSIEVLFCIFLSVSRVKQNSIENFLEIFNSIMYSFFIIMKIVSRADLSEKTRQEKLGLMMAGCLLLIILTNLVFITGLSLYLVGKSMKNCLKNKCCKGEVTTEKQTKKDKSEKNSKKSENDKKSKNDKNSENSGNLQFQGQHKKRVRFPDEMNDARNKAFEANSNKKKSSELTQNRNYILI